MGHWTKIIWIKSGDKMTLAVAGSSANKKMCGHFFMISIPIDITY